MSFVRFRFLLFASYLCLPFGSFRNVRAAIAENYGTLEERRGREKSESLRRFDQVSCRPDFNSSLESVCSGPLKAKPTVYGPLRRSDLLIFINDTNLLIDFEYFWIVS